VPVGSAAARTASIARSTLASEPVQRVQVERSSASSSISIERGAGEGWGFGFVMAIGPPRYGTPRSLRGSITEDGRSPKRTQVGAAAGPARRIVSRNRPCGNGCPPRGGVQRLDSQL